MATNTKLTFADYEAFPDDGNRYEIIDGEGYVSPSPNEAHQIAVGEIFTALQLHMRAHRLGRVYTAPFEIVLGPHDVFQPDVLYIARDRLHIVDARGRIRDAPDLCIEGASGSTRTTDRMVKFERYAHFGVAEYWIVDPDTRAVESYALDDWMYRLLALARGQERIVSHVFPNLILHADDAFSPPV